MYIKKSTLVCGAIILVIATAFLSICVVNPFGFTQWNDFLKFSYISKLIEAEYYEDVDADKYVDFALKGIAEATEDPYTMYLSGDTAEKYMEGIEGNYQGIGIYIENNTETNTIDVVSAIAGTPAEEAGLVTGDKILAVNGETYTGQQINDAVNAMRGIDGTEVTVTVRRSASAETEDIVFTRRKIEIPSVYDSMVTDEIGCIRITQFTSGVSDKFADSYNKLIDNGMEKLIIDLRNNPGGLMDEAVSIANMFIEDGNVIVYTLDKKEKRVDYPATGPAAKMQIVLLTNQGSASASEVLTGALKDYGVGYQIGEKTYGKGIVQSMCEIDDAVLSVTVARYFTPNGMCIHDEGIEPDETVTMNDEKYALLTELNVNDDEQMQAAIRYLTK